MSVLSDEESDEELFLIETRPKIHALNLESEDERFSAKDDRLGPPVAAWRSNLAASSQRRNLIFVAHGADIYAWIPHGPHQTLGTQPAMIINPVMKNPRAAGYIDRTAPHTINNILVDDLGRDEVLLLATDSGNICAYHVEAIYSTIMRCTSAGYKRPYSGSEVNPFFVENVGMSAWGLAMHKFARLIAISSNTRQITVFAFALVDPTSIKSDDQSQPSINQTTETVDDDWVKIECQRDLRKLRKSMPGNHRSKNLRLTYRGHLDNIPCVSFANFDLDANGEWMVSTDITNRVIIWRIWDFLSPFEIYYPGHPYNNPPQRGWTVLPLDPLLDVSRAIEDVYDASQVFDPDYQQIPDASDEEVDHDLPVEIFSSFKDDQAALKQDEVGYQAKRDNNRSENGIKSEKKNGSRHITREQPPLATMIDKDNQHYRVRPDLYHVSAFDQQPDLEALKARPVHPKSPSFFPVIHFSEHHISLAPYPLDSEYHILCKNSLFQRVFFEVEISTYCDRFNMVKYIPDLGIVVAASQKGRVAIISLTWQEKIGFGFRLDWIVPFKSQEAGNVRPKIPLLGLIVSPMPGYENPPDVPHIPQNIDPNDHLAFNYRNIDPEENDQTSSSSSFSRDKNSQHTHFHRPSDHSFPDSRFGPDTEQKSDPEEHESDKSMEDSDNDTPISKPINATHTVAEIHAQASRSFRPHEWWHGYHPSRHYRLLLLFYDHTVMSYEFWHDWKYTNK
ncbi:hypothetical protein N7493_009147 [Penicillium malachiteum]|uniref:Uncharacterized protein n=1 Tax=Penicillium malachiteum TaxID=1324776 RepID=A0AAD6HFY5_9EURO|nr:hypothetical protein N7493_009147 [Penicillium malachiteum]